MSSAPVRTDESGVYLRELLDVDYTDEQLRVATYPLAPQLVVAGAGSGKTAVMAARVVHAVAHFGVPPGCVLGLTFTTKAAGELAERVRRSLARLARRSGHPDGELPTVSTYHAYAAALVRDHALRIGREPVTTLLTEAGQWQLALRAARTATGPFEHLDWTTPHVARLVLQLSAEMSEHLVDADAIRDFDRKVIDAIEGLPRPVKDVALIASRARARDELLTIVAAYDEAKSRLDLIDYGDQVALAARIAERALAVGATERGRFRLVVLDEYQDTGVAQRLLLSRLYRGGHPVTAVGDPHQAIYGWRGASVGNLLRFGEHFPSAAPDGDRDGDGGRVGGRAVAMPLMTSFRCGGRVLSAANAIAAPLRREGGRRPMLDVPSLTAMAGRAEDGEVVVARVETDREEAELVADRLAAALLDGTPAGEMAVLARRRADFPRLHQALVARDIPVEVVGLGGLLEMPEVADVVAVLSLLVDATDNPSAVRLLTGPRWRIGVRDLAALGRRAARLAAAVARAEGDGGAGGERGLDASLRAATAAVDPVEVVSIVDAVESPGDLARYNPEAVDRFAAFTTELRRLRGLLTQPLVELVTEVVRTIGLDVEIEAEVARVAAARMANLAAFADHAARYSGLEGETDLRAFVGYLAAAADADNGLDAGSVSDADTVKLMTVHKAKGLEWDVVAVPGLVCDVFPSKQRRTPWTRGAHVLPFDCRGDAADLPVLRGYAKAELDSFDDDCRRDDADEERRLAYVAFTRARKLLLATGYCWAATRASRCDPSPFLTELRALGAPVVTEHCWCDEPPDDATNPCDGRKAGDVQWPAPIDPDKAVRRERSSWLVAAARAGETALPPDDVMEDEVAAHDRVWAEETRLLLAEAERARATVREVELPRRLTASQVVALAEDPDGLAQSLARPLPRPPQPQARRGSRFHAWVEQLYAAAPLLEPDDLPGSGDDDLSDVELAELQRRFLDSGWADRRPVAVEQAFELLVGGRLVRGRIDAVYPVRDGDGATVGYDVVDYKTGVVPADFAAASLQLSVYRVAWADLAGCDPASVSAAFLYIRTGTLKPADRLLSRDELAELLSDPPTSIEGGSGLLR
jgi:DNA helicase-2/ATP-dependent DNA helicase PcrA